MNLRMHGNGSGKLHTVRGTEIYGIQNFVHELSTRQTTLHTLLELYVENALRTLLRGPWLRKYSTVWECVLCTAFACCCTQLRQTLGF